MNTTSPQVDARLIIHPTGNGIYTMTQYIGRHIPIPRLEMLTGTCEPSNLITPSIHTRKVRNIQILYE